MASHVSVGSGTNTTSNDQSVQTPTRRAKVWDHFEQELVEVNGVMKAACKYCGMKLTNKRDLGTSSLRNHIAGTCLKISDEDRKRFIDTMKKDQQKAHSYLTLERLVSGWLSGALVPRLHSTSLMILSLLHGWSHCTHNSVALDIKQCIMIVLTNSR
jgi:hypothetical protein